MNRIQIVSVFFIIFAIGFLSDLIDRSDQPTVMQGFLSGYAIASQATPTSEGHTRLVQASQLTPEEIYFLQKLRMQEELQDDLLRWAQSRFWIIAIISLLVGFFGVRALVRDMLSTELKDATRASADAQAAASQGRDAVKDLRAEAAKYKDIVQDITTTAADVDKQLKELRSRIDAEGARTTAASDMKITALDQQVSEIGSMVKKLASESRLNRDAVRDSEIKIDQVRKDAASKQSSFEDNSKYDIAVVHHGSGSSTEQVGIDIVSALSAQGFRASAVPWTKGAEVHDIVDIDYTTRGKKKVELVRSLVADVLQSHKYPAETSVHGLRNYDTHRDLRVIF